MLSNPFYELFLPRALRDKLASLSKENWATTSRVSLRGWGVARSPAGIRSTWPLFTVEKVWLGQPEPSKKQNQGVTAR